MENRPVVKFKKLNPEGVIPTRGSAFAAGLDLYALDFYKILEPGERFLFSTGISMELPPLHEGQLRPRSGLAFKSGVTVVNSPGTIDEDYRGELKVLLINHSKETVTIQKGDRIAQIVIAPVSYCDVKVIEELSDTTRGTGGYGSTGK